MSAYTLRKSVLLFLACLCMNLVLIGHTSNDGKEVHLNKSSSEWISFTHGVEPFKPVLPQLHTKEYSKSVSMPSESFKNRNNTSSANVLALPVRTLRKFSKTLAGSQEQTTFSFEKIYRRKSPIFGESSLNSPVVSCTTTLLAPFINSSGDIETSFSALCIGTSTHLVWTGITEIKSQGGAVVAKQVSRKSGTHIVIFSHTDTACSMACVGGTWIGRAQIKVGYSPHDTWDIPVDFSSSTSFTNEDCVPADPPADPTPIIYASD